NIAYRLETMVIDVKPHSVTYINSTEGLVEIEAEAIILAMGCRERARGSLNIPGFRPSGVFSAGTAQRLVNIEGKKVGHRVFILGSGDIGLIMARRMTFEGATVLGVAELMPYSGGLKRNIVQCLDDFDIPLYLSHTVTKIEGKERVEAVTIAQVDAKRTPIPGTEKRFECDTLLLSVGLLPENELSRKADINISNVTNGPLVDENLTTNADGIFACGNVLHVHDLVDYVTQEATLAGVSAAKYLAGNKSENTEVIAISAQEGVRYTVPQFINLDTITNDITVRFRVSDVYKNRNIVVYFNEEKVKSTFKRVLAPGEMELVVLKQAELKNFKDLKTIVIKTEEKQ
ncbi:MAG: FAD-dependent oxidoreductase, partial [Spirochaetales bacterium]|nr:FAD-dependent oxidoreductase [Spirochaetales bacterium]